MKNGAWDCRHNCPRGGGGPGARGVGVVSRRRHSKQTWTHPSCDSGCTPSPSDGSRCPSAGQREGAKSPSPGEASPILIPEKGSWTLAEASIQVPRSGEQRKHRETWKSGRGPRRCPDEFPSPTSSAHSSRFPERVATHPPLVQRVYSNTTFRREPLCLSLWLDPRLLEGASNPASLTPAHETWCSRGRWKG